MNNFAEWRRELEAAIKDGDKLHVALLLDKMEMEYQGLLVELEDEFDGDLE